MPAAPKYVVRCQKNGEKRHVYLLDKKNRGQYTWGNFLRTAIFNSFEEARADAEGAKLQAYQIVPVGYEGPNYWENRSHVRHEGSMAQYRNPRVFLICKETGKWIEV